MVMILQTHAKSGRNRYPSRPTTQLESIASHINRRSRRWAVRTRRRFSTGLFFPLWQMTFTLTRLSL